MGGKLVDELDPPCVPLRSQQDVSERWIEALKFTKAINKVDGGNRLMQIKIHNRS